MCKEKALESITPRWSEQGFPLGRAWHTGPEAATVFCFRRQRCSRYTTIMVKMPLFLA